MRKAIFKYLLDIQDENKISMPKGAEILTCQTQNDKQPCVWAIIDTEQKETEVRHFEILGTGHTANALNEGYKRIYISTFQILNGSLVFHLFEINNNNG